MTISSVLTSQAQNMFVDGLFHSFRTILRAMQLKILDEMIKAALEEEQAYNNLKPKYDSYYKSSNSVYKPKCFNCDGFGHLSKECRKPRKASSNAGENTGTFIKK